MDVRVGRWALIWANNYFVEHPPRPACTEGHVAGGGPEPFHTNAAKQAQGGERRPKELNTPARLELLLLDEVEVGAGPRREEGSPQTTKTTPEAKKKLRMKLTHTTVSSTGFR